jgi:hypothetical protein
MTSIPVSAPAAFPGSPHAVDQARPVSFPVRVAGLFAAAAGLIFAGIQPIHPADALASVTTVNWMIIIALKLAACLFFLIGTAGLYFRQGGRAGWLGFSGFALFTLSWWLQTAFVFAELVILPQLASVAPEFVTSFLGIFNGHPGAMDVSGLASAYRVVGLSYLVGGILFGVATWRAGVLPRLPSAVLAIAALVTPAAALLQHEIQRFAAVPMGIAFVWLGFAMWFGAGASQTTSAN